VAPFAAYDVILQALSPDGSACGALAQAGSATADDEFPALGTQSAGGGSGDEALCVFREFDLLPPTGPTGVRGQPLRGPRQRLRDVAGRRLR
jgi:hypothetical protein